MRFLRAAAVTLLALAVACCGLTLYVGERLTHPSRVPIATSPAAWGLAYRNVSFPARIDHTPLSGWWIPAAAARGTIVLASGYAENRLTPPVPALAVAAALHAARYNVLMFDFRASGRSGGTLVTVGGLEQRDVEGAAAFAGQRPSVPVGVLGWSMGASTALLAAEHDPAIAAVVADSPFAALTTYLRGYLPIWTHLPAFPFTPLFFWLVPPIIGVNPQEADPLSAMASLASRPVLLIAGTADHTIPPTNAERLAAADPTAQIWLVAGAGHIRAYHTDPAAYMRHVLALFARMP